MGPALRPGPLPPPPLPRLRVAASPPPGPSPSPPASWASSRPRQAQVGRCGAAARGAGGRVSAGHLLRAPPHRAAPAASGLALLRSRIGSVRAGVSGSPPAGRGYMARGGWGREEESLGALLSPPPGGGARAALAGLTPPRPARSSPARPGPDAAASAPHPLPGRRGGWEGARTKCGFSCLPGGGRSAGPRQLGLLLLSLTPLPPLSTCGAPGQGGGGARTESDDNCQKPRWAGWG